MRTESKTEKRAFPRTEYEAPMDLYRMDYQDQSSYAHLRDYSQGGMSLITKEELVLGHYIYLEMKNFDPSAAGPHRKKSYNGSVRWINTIPSDSNTPKLYRYGIQFSNPASPDH